MTAVLVLPTAILGGLFLWGAVAPRSQWYALVGWTRSDPRSSEPGSGAYSVSRIICLLGLLALMVLGAGSVAGLITFPGTESRRAITTEERVWGEPRSFVVDRVFTPISAPPTDLIPQPLDGFQSVGASSRSPRYLFEMGRMRHSGIARQPGFLGVEPLPGTIALDTADFVVHVRADDNCIPQRVVAIPVEGAVQLGVFFGRPRAADGTAGADIADCDPSPPIGRTRAYLVPVDLDPSLDGLALQGLDGTALLEVPAP